jgi:hypothetical protein
MRKTINTKANIVTRKMQRQFEHKNEVMLNVDIEYPSIGMLKGGLAQMKININYFSIANKFYRYAMNTLFPNAIEQHDMAIKNGYPFNPYEAVMKYTVMLNDNCNISTYFDQYEYTGGAHGNTLRTSSTHSLQTGDIIELKDLFKNTENYKALIIEQIQIKADEILTVYPGIYFDNYKELIVENFNVDNFYLTPTTIDFYYQQYDIAPYSTGIVVFSIPYEKLGIKSPQCITKKVK